ncbi:MAG: ROK family transcriptional regulator [Candidatus Omnitrophica bacterium]|nr:ROK family transcriptional regulator [Candidatus Omnitrophota bacterium]
MKNEELVFSLSRPQLGSNSFHYHRRQNYARVLLTIKEFSPISRPEIAKRTGLSHPTVVSIVQELYEKKLVRLKKASHSDVGRNPFLVEFQSQIGVVAGVDVGLESYGIVADLNAKVLMEHRSSLSKTNFSCDLLGDLINHLLQTYGQNNLLGIAVSLSGLVSLAGEYLWMEKNQKFPVKKELEKRFGVPVIVENDANMMMLAESRIGIARGVSQAIYVIKTSSGIGFGILINGSIYRGYQGCAGENLGIVPEEVRTPEGDPSPSFITGLNRLIHLFDPEMIILGGALAKVGETFLEKVRKSVNDRQFPREGVRIETGVVGRESIIQEVVNLGIEKLLGFE